MKLTSIIYAIAIGLSASVQAQEKATNPNEPSKSITPLDRVRSVPDPAAASGTGGTVTPATSSIVSITMELFGGRLVDAIADIENHVSGGGAGALPMPTLIYSADEVREFPLPGKFRLTGVTPVQAVALACAAAGCTLEPIYAPAEEAALPGASGPTNPGKVIGYRIVRASASGGDFFGSRIPTPTVTQLGGGGVSKGGYGDAMVSRGGEVTQLAGGGASKGGAGGNTAPVASSSFSSGRERLMSYPQFAPSADTTERVVRVYALGSLLARTGENSSVETHDTQKRRSEMILSTQDLIGLALAQAELKAAKSPDLSFNEGLRVLVAKATAAQHEIISQVIQALKENETAPAQANTVVPTAETPIPAPAPSAEKPKSNP